MTSSTCIRPVGIMSYLLTNPCLVVFAPLKATVHGVGAGADACVAACFTVAIYPWFYRKIISRICIIILLISAHSLPWFIIRWVKQITSGDGCPLFAIRAVQFRRANDHFIFGRVRSRLGRKSLVAAARVACAEVHCLGSILYASKLYQRKAVKQTFVYKLRVNWVEAGCYLLNVD